MTPKASKHPPLLVGQRVRHRKDQRSALVVGKPQMIGTRMALVPVIIESSTRSELWPETLVVHLPKRSQFPAHGGRFSAPSGYPLRTKA